MSKNAVSYSSPSRMKCLPAPSRKLQPKFSAMPPIRNDGSRPARLEDPGKHRSRCRFAVCSSDDQHFFTDQKFVVKNLRQRAKRDSLVEHVLKLDIAARERIADYHQIRPRIEIRLGKRLRYGDSKGLEKGRHWRIRGRIRTGNTEVLARAACQQAKPLRFRKYRSDECVWNSLSSQNARLSSVPLCVHCGYRFVTAASRIWSLTSLPTSSRARTPIGKVIFDRETWPERNPNATGTPRSPTTRSTTSSSV